MFLEFCLNDFLCYLAIIFLPTTEATAVAAAATDLILVVASKLQLVTMNFKHPKEVKEKRTTKIKCK